MHKHIELAGKKIWMLTGVRRSDDYISPKGWHQTRWIFTCECGNETLQRPSQVISGVIKSCGCTSIAGAATKRHGLSDIPEYAVWAAMKSRCLNPDSPHYSSYGGRGISISDDWMSFEHFIRDMGRRPSKRHSIDRVDNNKGYCKENCRWTTQKFQMRNTRFSSIVEYMGQKKSVSQWCEDLNLHASTVHNRIWRGETAPDRIFSKKMLYSEKTTKLVRANRWR